MNWSFTSKLRRNFCHSIFPKKFLEVIFLTRTQTHVLKHKINKYTNKYVLKSRIFICAKRFCPYTGYLLQNMIWDLRDDCYYNFLSINCVLLYINSFFHKNSLLQCLFQISNSLRRLSLKYFWFQISPPNHPQNWPIILNYFGTYTRIPVSLIRPISRELFIALLLNLWRNLYDVGRLLSTID